MVTLIVTPQDAVTLNYLMLSGAKLNIVLRSAGDPTRVDTEAVTLQFLMDQYRIPNPAKLPYGTEPRIDSFPDYIPMFPEPGPSPTPAQ
jgi:pilus assembly protein CpaB